MATDDQPRQRRIRFSLRRLLLMILVLGVGLGWFGAQLKWMHQRREALQWIVPLRERQIAAARGRAIPPAKGAYVQHGGIDAPWSLGLFGEHGVERIEVDRRWFTSESRLSLSQLRSLFPEAEIVFTSSYDVNRMTRFNRNTGERIIKGK